MRFFYKTKRLLLEILGEEAAPYVLAFYQKNKDIFERWDPMHCANFYTLEYQAHNLATEMKLFLHQKHFRYYLFLSAYPGQVVGTISFTHISGSPEFSCRLGYRLSKEVQGYGYATEALSYLIPIFIREQKVLRIEANIMPQNTASIHLIETLGFEYEGVARKIFEINGKREDHLRYAFVVS